MSFAFQCPVCQTIHTVAKHLVGRRVHCPACDAVVEVTPVPDAGLPLPKVPLPNEADRLRTEVERARRTVALHPPPPESGETIILEAVDIAPPGSVPQGRVLPPLPPVDPPLTQHFEEEFPEEKPIHKSRLGDTEMDMTPMVDVTFQLLIFFMITAAFALQKAKEIPKPEPTDPSTNVVQETVQEASDTVTVKIDEFNTFTVINTDGDEEEAPSVQDLYIKLRRAKSGGSSGRPPTKLRVESHGDALHEKVVAALDAGNETGFAELELATLAEDAE